MSNNRHLIDDSEICRPIQVLDKGLPIPGLRGHYVVDEGWRAVITEGGAFAEILEPGHHYLDHYGILRDVKAIAVDMRVQTMTITTRSEFSIAVPVAVQIDLDLAVEYRVADARRVALEIKSPLTSLYDRVMLAVRGVVAHATIDEVRGRGEVMAHTVLQQLQAANLPKVLGLEVSNVLVTSIKATSVGNDALAKQDMNRYTRLSDQQIDEQIRVRDWQLDNLITSQSRITWEWLVMHQPALAQQYLVNYGAIAKEMVDKGLLDPAGVLNQPVTGTGASMNFLGPFGGFPGQLLPGTPASTQQLGPPDPRKRVNEEIHYLQSGLPGSTLEVREGKTAEGASDGTYSYQVEYTRSSGGKISLYMECPAGYPAPAFAPSVDVKVDSEPVPFDSSTVRRWSDQFWLIDIAREVKQYFG